MKTSLTQYIEGLKNGNCKGEEYYIELEKQQIIDAYDNGIQDVINDGESDSKHYYERTFTTNKETLK